MSSIGRAKELYDARYDIEGCRHEITPFKSLSWGMALRPMRCWKSRVPGSQFCAEHSQTTLPPGVKFQPIVAVTSVKLAERNEAMEEAYAAVQKHLEFDFTNFLNEVKPSPFVCPHCGHAHMLFRWLCKWTANRRHRRQIAAAFQVPLHMLSPAKKMFSFVRLRILVGQIWYRLFPKKQVPLAYPAEWLLDVFNGSGRPVWYRENWLNEAEKASSHARVCIERDWLQKMGRSSRNEFWRFRHELIRARGINQNWRQRIFELALLNQFSAFDNAPR